MLRIKSFVCVQTTVKNDTFLMEVDLFERSQTCGSLPGFFLNKKSSKKDFSRSVKPQTYYFRYYL